MRKQIVLGVAAILALVLAGCGGGDSRPVFVAQILSDQPSDGDIAFDGVTFTPTQGPVTLFFGIDDNDPDFPEYRAFLDFPLDGSTGQDVVPANAVIVSATLEIFIDRVNFADPVPALLDLVEYVPGSLVAADFTSVPLAFRSLDFFATGTGNFVAIDVTPLMREAQRRGLPDFQVRFLLDFALSNFGFVGIEDRPNIALTAPLLTVEYR
ncbi:MAG: hypothetical protein Kow00128_14560 [Deltaproteobacteria bacterium]